MTVENNINSAEGKGHFVSIIGMLLNQFDIQLFELKFIKNEKGQISRIYLEAQINE